MKNHSKRADAPSGRQTIPPAPKSLGSAKTLLSNEADAKSIKGSDLKKGERAGSAKRKRIHRRASELAMSQGKGKAGESDLRRAKRELLGLQTLPDPDDPMSSKDRKT